MAAMMADELTAEAVLDQPGRAIGTLEAMAAGAAQGQRRVAAAVEEEQRLLAAPPRLLDRADQARRQPEPARRRLAAKIDRFEPRQRARAEARGELQPCVASVLGIDPRLDRRRRRSEHDGGAFDPPAHHRHVAGMVRDAVLLFVRGLVLLVDDDQAEIAKGQE